MSSQANAVAYAALLLQDSKLPITEENLTKLTSKAGVKLPNGFTKVFAKVVEGQNISSWISLGGSSSAAPAAETAKPTEAAKPAEAPKPAKVEEPEEDVDMGGLFD